MSKAVTVSVLSLIGICALGVAILSSYIADHLTVSYADAIGREYRVMDDGLYTECDCGKVHQ